MLVKNLLVVIVGTALLQGCGGGTAPEADVAETPNAPPPPGAPPGIPPESICRSCWSKRLAIVQPPLSGPTRFLASARTSSKKT